MTGTTGKVAVGWNREPAPAASRAAPSLIVDLGPVTKLFAAKTTATQPLPDTTSLGAEVMHLKNQLARHDDPMLRGRIVARQSEWVAMAKKEGRSEPSRPLDPFRATPKQIENAFLWSECGGIAPRDELARDGGAAFRTSIRDAVVLRMRGFDALVKLYEGDPDAQRALYVKELGLRGVKVSNDAASNLDSLRALHGQSLRDEQTNRSTMGLDGRVGSATAVDAYERHETVEAMNPGSTLGSVMATYSAVATGELDVNRMRAMGNAGNAAEGVLGGPGEQINRLAAEREPPGAPKPDIDNFNRTGLKPRFKNLKAMNSKYEGEDRPGNKQWNPKPDTSMTNSAPHEVKYATRPTDRAPYKIEAREVSIDGKKQMRLFDANGNLFDTRNATSLHTNDPRAIFVMNAQGDLFATPFHERAYTHHSTLSGGEPVAAAGELIVENGRVVGITNQSGHDQPDAKMTEQAITALREKGIDLKGVTVTIRSPDGWSDEKRTLQ